MMMAPASSRVEAAGRMPSIECEPKTLTLDQIKFAREAALYVVTTKTEEEAIRIFTEGLKPVRVAAAAAAAVSKSNSFDSSSDDDVDLGCSSSSSSSDTTTKSRRGSKGGHRGCCRRRRCSFDKDFATAPF